MENYIEDKTYKNIDFTGEGLSAKEYENCTFMNCNFQMANFSGIKFIECEFLNCNLSSARLEGAAFQDTLFQDSKMLGLHFEDCNPFGFAIQIDQCQLDHSSFYKIRMKGMKITNSRLYEVDFTECDLQNAEFEHCDLLGAVFFHTNLTKADFHTSINYHIDPEQNKIKKAKFSREGLIGLLSKYDIVLTN